MSQSTPQNKSKRIELHSPFRPLTTGFKRRLHRDGHEPEYDDNGRTVFVASMPNERLLEEYEIEHVRHDSPEEVWTNGDQRIEIFSDRVEVGGKERTITPKDAKERARYEPSFTMVEPSDT